jgi:hypothetical protein
MANDKASRDDEMPRVTDPNVSPNLRRGGPLPGFKKKYSRESIRALAKLDFDPIQKMVQLYHRIDAQLTRQEELQAMKDVAELETGKQVKNGYSAMAHMGFATAQEKLLNDLIPYRYAKIPVDEAKKDDVPPPLTIELTQEGDVFVIDPSETDYEEVEALLREEEDVNPSAPHPE